MPFSLAYRIWSSFRNGYETAQFECHKKDNVDKSSKDSFPCSDPPSQS